LLFPLGQEDPSTQLNVLNTQPESEYLEGYSPILKLIAKRLTDDPDWSLNLLNVVVRQLALPLGRRNRDSSVNLDIAILAGLEVATLAPGELDDKVKLAHLLARAGRLEESLDWITAAIAQAPDVVDYYRLQASVLERMQRFLEAEKVINSTTRFGSGSAWLLEDKRRIGAAVIQHFRALRDSSPDLPSAINAGIEVMVRCPDSKDDDMAFENVLRITKSAAETRKLVDQAVESFPALTGEGQMKLERIHLLTANGSSTEPSKTPGAV
jgi:tetratricopeptide (TPR) repeat protein